MKKVRNKLLIFITMALLMAISVVAVNASVPPTITTVLLPSGNVGVSYSATINATGDTPMTWLHTYGVLPNGLTLNADGSITGIPTLIGTFTFAVEAANNYGDHEVLLSITISPTLIVTPPNIITTSLPNANLGILYLHTLQATGSTPVTWTVISGSLPNGLTLDYNGVITGIPTAAGDSTFTVRAVNAAGAVQRQLTLRVVTDTPIQENEGYGRLLLELTNATNRNPINGTAFEIRRHIDEALMGTITTNNLGEATIWLPEGVYFAREITPAWGFQANTSRQPFRINSDQVTTLRLTSGPMDFTQGGQNWWTPPFHPPHQPTPTPQPTGYLNIRNICIVTNADLIGAVFNVNQGNRIVSTITVGMSAAINLPIGTYTVTERIPANGYMENPAPHQITVRNGATVTINALSTPTVLAQQPTVPPPTGTPPDNVTNINGYNQNASGFNVPSETVNVRPPQTIGRLPFGDVWESDWHFAYVSTVFQNGIFAGVERNIFAPNAPMTRGMFAQVMANFDGMVLRPVTRTSFSDVSPDDWFAPAIEWAYYLNLLEGVGDGRFAPHDYITREQMAVLVQRYMRHRSLPMQVGFNTALNDDSQISDWARESVHNMIHSDIISPHFYRPYFFFRPTQAATRAEVASMFARIIWLIEIMNERIG